MAGPFKVTIAINTDVGLEAGWTESFYTPSGADPDGVITNYITSGDQAKRLSLLHPDYVMWGIRVVDVTKPNVSRVLILDDVPNQGQYPGVARSDGNSMPPWVSVLMRLDTADGRRRMFHLRGLPRGVVTDTFDYVGFTNPTWQPLFRLFMGTICQQAAFGQFPATPPPVSPWSLRKVTYSPPQSFSLVTPFTPQNGFSATLAAATTPNVAVPGRIRVSKDTSAAFWNGVWRVQTVGAPPGLLFTTFSKKRLIKGVPNVAFGALCQTQVIDYVPVNFTQGVRGGKKDTGRPFGLLVGKRKTITG